MFSKVWQAFANWFGINNKRTIPIKTKHQKKERFLIAQDPFLKTRILPEEKITQNEYGMPKNGDELMNIYRIQCKFQQNQDQMVQQAKENDEFIFEMKKINEVLIEIQKQSNQLLTDTSSIFKQQVKNLHKKIGELQLFRRQQKQTYEMYSRNILNKLQTKYSGEKASFPFISFEEYKKVANIFYNGMSNQNLVPGYNHLRYCHVYRLREDQWLNDEIITQNINLMNEKLSQRQNNTYIIFNSLKVTSIFDKSDYQKMQKIIQKNKVTRKSTLILAINHNNVHWYFIKMDRYSILIYDSLMKQLIMYKDNALMKKIVKFAQIYYEARPSLQQSQNYPQQFNNDDCGVMMLCGIKDVVRDCNNWTFSRTDMPYKRVLIAHQLLTRQITGF